MLTQKSLIFEPACALYLYLSGICLMLLESIPEIIKDVLWGFKTGCYDTGSFYRVPWCLAILKQQATKSKKMSFLKYAQEQGVPLDNALGAPLDKALGAISPMFLLLRFCNISAKGRTSCYLWCGKSCCCILLNKNQISLW